MADDDMITKLSSEIISVYSEQIILTFEQLKSSIIKGIFLNPSVQQTSFNNGINYAISIIDSNIKILKELTDSIKKGK